MAIFKDLGNDLVEGGGVNGLNKKFWEESFPSTDGWSAA
jgi:hypothetical protein